MEFQGKDSVNRAYTLIEEEARWDTRNKTCPEVVDFLSSVKGVTADLGCGDGAYLHHLQKKTNFLIGVDVSRLRLKRAKNVHKDLVRADASKLCFNDGIFDSVVLIEVLEHLTSVEEALNEVSRVLKSQGKAYITIPNKFVFRISRFVDDKLLLHYESTKTHYSEMTYAEAKKMISKNFRILSIKGRLGHKWPKFLFWLKKCPPLTPSLMISCKKYGVTSNFLEKTRHIK